MNKGERKEKLNICSVVCTIVGISAMLINSILILVNSIAKPKNIVLSTCIFLAVITIIAYIIRMAIEIMYGKEYENSFFTIASNIFVICISAIQIT